MLWFEADANPVRAVITPMLYAGLLEEEAADFEEELHPASTVHAAAAAARTRLVRRCERPCAAPAFDVMAPPLLSVSYGAAAGPSTKALTQARSVPGRHHET